MEPSCESDFSLAGLGAAGLLISDTSEGRMVIFSLLCAGASADLRALAPPATPELARLGARLAARKAAERELRPIVGELFHFARSSPGGVPVREVGHAAVPTVAVIKKVAASDWNAIVAAGHALFDAVELAFAPNLRARAAEGVSVALRPGDVESRELSAFSAHVERQLRAFQTAKCRVERQARLHGRP